MTTPSEDKDLVRGVLIGLYDSDIEKLDQWREQLAREDTYGGAISRSRMVRILIREHSQQTKAPSPPTSSPFSNPTQR